MRKIFLFACLYAAAFSAASAESPNAEMRRALDARCEQARAEKLKPVQQQKVEECMREPAPDRGEKKTREQCEKYWSDYGWGAVTAEGTRNASLYEQIPECVAAFKARQSEGR